MSLECHRQNIPWDLIANFREVSILVKVSAIAVLTHHDLKQLGEERFNFSLQLLGYTSMPRKARLGTKTGQEPGGKSWCFLEKCCSLACSSWLAQFCFLIHSRTIFQGLHMQDVTIPLVERGNLHKEQWGSQFWSFLSYARKGHTWWTPQGFHICKDSEALSLHWCPSLQADYNKSREGAAKGSPLGCGLDLLMYRMMVSMENVF